MTSKRHAMGLVLQLRKQADVTSKRHAKGLVVKLRKQADETPKRHTREKNYCPQIKETSRWDPEKECKGKRDLSTN